MSASWDGSDRRETLPPGWDRIRREQLELDGGRCTWILPSKNRCPRPATDVDHKHESRPDLNRVGVDLQSLCSPHHGRKTAVAAFRFKRAKAAKRVRPAEVHPGRLS